MADQSPKRSQFCPETERFVIKYNLKESVHESLPSHWHELFSDITGSWGPSVEFLVLVAFQLALSMVFSFDEGKQESSLREEDCI